MRRDGLSCVEGEPIDFSDGELVDVGGSWGIGLGKGSITVAAEYRRHNRTNRASFDPRDQVAAGGRGSNAVAQPNHRWGDPDTRDTMTFVNASVPLNRGGDPFPLRVSAASAGASGQQRRASIAGRSTRATGRRSIRSASCPRSSPRWWTCRERPASAAAFRQWTYDVSGGYGRNSFAFTIGDSLNVSLGPAMPPNKTRFEAGTLLLNQFVGNVDVTRPVAVGRFAGP